MTKERIRAYSEGGGEKSGKVVKLVENGRLGTAARTLVGDSRVADADGDTMDRIRTLHPAGSHSPFDNAVGRSQGRAPSTEDIQAAFDSLRSNPLTQASPVGPFPSSAWTCALPLWSPS